jgi:hypothetical protein
MIQDDIRTLLEAPPVGTGAPSLESIEHTLTTGYARALALEAERSRLERRIVEVAGRSRNGTGDDAAAELARLGRLLARADDDLSCLRGLLASLRDRAAEVRAVV